MRTFGLKFLACLVVVIGVILLVIVSILSLILAMFLGAAEALINKMDWWALRLFGLLKPVGETADTTAHVPEDSAHSHGGGDVGTFTETARDTCAANGRSGSDDPCCGDPKQPSPAGGNGAAECHSDSRRIGSGLEIGRERLAAGSLVAGDLGPLRELGAPSQVGELSATDRLARAHSEANRLAHIRIAADRLASARFDGQSGEAVVDPADVYINPRDEVAQNLPKVGP